MVGTCMGGACSIQVACTTLSNLPKPPSRVALDVSHYPHHGGAAHASGRATIELRLRVFLSPTLFSFFFEKHVGIAKNQRNLVICLLNNMRSSLA